MMRITFQLASDDPNSGYTVRTDELGKPVFISAEPFLTEREVWSAAVFEGGGRVLVRLDLSTIGGDVLEQVTRANRGKRLAVYLDDDLTLSPPLRQPIVGGRMYLDGDFTKAEAERIVRAVERHRAAVMPIARPTGPGESSSSPKGTVAPAEAREKTQPKEQTIFVPLDGPPPAGERRRP